MEFNFVANKQQHKMVTGGWEYSDKKHSDNIGNIRPTSRAKIVPIFPTLLCMIFEKFFKSNLIVHFLNETIPSTLHLYGQYHYRHNYNSHPKYAVHFRIIDFINIFSPFMRFSLSFIQVLRALVIITIY